MLYHPCRPVTLQPQPSLFHDLQRETSSWKAPARTLSINDTVLSEDESMEVWASYLQSLTSWDGPIDPDVLWSWFTGTSCPSSSPGTRLPEHVVRDGKVWLAHASSDLSPSSLTDVFSWAELCEGLHAMNHKAAVSPLDPLPSSVLQSPCEEFRSLVLALVSLAWIVGKCPPHWLCATVIPVHKPGKPEELPTSYRPISLLPFWYKILDRLLFHRVWPHIKQRTVPWQHGGVLGTDMAFAFFHELVLLRKKDVLPQTTQFIFLDGQAAFCRPPSLTVLNALRQLPMIHSLDIRLICEMLAGLKSRACILGDLTRVWQNETGLPQGGTLSVALFVLLTDILYQSLLNDRLGVEVPQRHFLCPMIGYVDDLVLCMESVEMQAALDMVDSWSKDIRMKINVGPEKSAVLCPVSSSDDCTYKVGGRQLPQVDTYRYLGGLVAFDGAVLPALKDVEARIIAKTGSLLRWSQAQRLPVPLVCKLWVILVENAFMWLLAALPLTDCHLRYCDRIQRKTGRILLSFQSRSPIAPVLLELAWVPWSILVRCHRVALFWRCLRCQQSLMKSLVPLTATIPGTWASMVLLDVERVVGRKTLEEPPLNFEVILRQYQQQQTALARADLIRMAQANGMLLHYPVPAWNVNWTLGAVNTPLNRLSSRTKASAICRRLFTGGQGLRGGDRLACTLATVHNCCLFCLTQGGVRHAEVLQHFLISCPLTSGKLLVVESDIEHVLDFPHALGYMPLSRLRRFQDALLSAWEVRKLWMKQSGVLKASSAVQLARSLW